MLANIFCSAKADTDVRINVNRTVSPTKGLPVFGIALYHCVKYLYKIDAKRDSYTDAYLGAFFLKERVVAISHANPIPYLIILHGANIIPLTIKCKFLGKQFENKFI
jgi:hypothetical protein